MGNYFACPCYDSSTSGGVLVMKLDGTLLKLRKGVRAREAVETFPGHMLVRCCSDRSVVTGSVQLESNRLYFLVPEGSERCRETYEMFWRTGVSMGLLPPKRKKEGCDGEITVGQALVVEPSETKRSSFLGVETKRSFWTPALKTIEEITSPTLNGHARETLPAAKVN